MSEATPRRGRLGRFVLRSVLLVVVPLAVVMIALHFYARGGRYVATENAYVKAHVIAITPEVSGRVVWLGTADNTFATEGAPLFRIDQDPYRIAMDQGEARLSITRTEIETLRANYREGVVDEGRAKDNVAFQQTQLERQRRIRERGMGSEESFDQARHELALAQRELQAARARTARMLVALGDDPNMPVEQHARFQQAMADLNRARLDLQRTQVIAPATGIVSNLKLQVGEYVEAGSPVFTLIQADPVWIEANLKETQLTHVRVGQHVRVRIDAYPGRSWTAQVSTIAPATGAEFALLPPQNATGNWVKVVQRVPVHLHVERSADAPLLRAGMTASISIDTGHQRELPVFAHKLIRDGGVLAPLHAFMGRALAWNRNEAS